MQLPADAACGAAGASLGAWALPPAGETWLESLAPGSSLDHSWLLLGIWGLNQLMKSQPTPHLLLFQVGEKKHFNFFLYKFYIHMQFANIFSHIVACLMFSVSFEEGLVLWRCR